MTAGFVALIDGDDEVRSSLQSRFRFAGRNVCGYGPAEAFLADDRGAEAAIA